MFQAIVVLLLVVCCLTSGFLASWRPALTRVQCPSKLAAPQSPGLLHPAASILFSSTTPPSPEIFAFESNVARVMDIIINSLYSNKDVFIRELISNAADACDKKRFLTLTSATPVDRLFIRVSADRNKNTLTIEDSGIGMNKADLIQNLGRIAESGTKKFMDNIGKDKDAVSLIGQFGVGFYSSFLVADKVSVITKGSEGVQLRWEASGNSLGKYSITPDDSEPIASTGTRIVLHLKEESDQYLDDVALKALIEKYSEFISFPIELLRNVTRPESIPDTSKSPEADGTIAMKTVMNKVQEWGVVNQKKPLWLRPPRDCAASDYEDFYQQTFKAYDKPAAHVHFSMEGSVDFKALLFLPSELPYELSRDMFAPSARSMRLYVKRVFINDNFEDLIPRWLIFLRGVVDSDDLPLNVGREILQQSRSLRIIKQRIVKKAVDMMLDLMKTNETAYNSFFKNFGRYIKLGLIEDEKNRQEMIPLCKFYSSRSGDNMTSLTDYLSRMPADQKKVYYVIGATRDQAALSPSLESFKQKGYEILYITETLDEMTLQAISEVDGKGIVDTGKESSMELSPEEKRDKEEKNMSYEEFRGWVKMQLGDKVTRVEVSSRLVESPATLLQSEYGVSPTMQKFLKAQQDSADMAQYQNAFNQAVLEINPEHAVIKDIKRLYELDTNSADAKERVQLVYHNAALAAGYALDNAVEYAKMVTNLLIKLSS